MTTTHQKVGRYQLVDELDSPSGGRRYRAIGEHTGPNRLLLYKQQAPPDSGDTGAFRTLFFESATLCRDLGHPNLSPVLDFGEQNGECFLVQDLIAGQTLEQVLEELMMRGMRLPVNSVAYIAHQICTGLSFAHTLTDPSGRPLSPMHLALEPSTVLIGYDGSVRVLDAGMVPSARISSSGAGTWGRARYFSPERIKGEGIDPRSDIYAVGVILYEALTQRSLFARQTDEESMADILAGVHSSVSDHASEIPVSLDRIVSQALRVSPEERFGTAWELEEALRDVVGGVELRRSRSVLSGMMNTIFAELRDEAQARLHEAIEGVEAGAGFSEDAPGVGDDFSDLDSVVTPLPIDGFARAAAERRKVVATKEAVEEAVGGASGRISRFPRHEVEEARAPAAKPEPAKPAPPRRPASAPPRPAPRSASAQSDPAGRGKPWKLVVGTALVMTLALVALTTIGQGRHLSRENEVSEVDAGQDVIARLVQEYPDPQDLDGSKAKQGWQALLEGSEASVGAARGALEEGVVADPLNLPAVAGLAVVYAFEGVDDSARALDSVGLLSRAQALKKDDVYTLRAEAGVALGSQGYPRALAAARSCQEAFPEDSVCAYFEGLALVGAGRVAESIKPLELAAERLSSSSGLSLALGRAALANGDFARAMEVLSGGAERFPRNASLQAELAHLYHRTANFDEALASAERAVEVDSGHLEARLLRGELLLQVAGKRQQAALALSELAKDPALEKHPLRRRALVMASFAALGGGRGKEALAFAEQAVALAPGDGPAQLALALAYSESGDPEAAGEALLAAELSGLSGREAARFHYHAARLFLEHGREKFARTQLESALEADPNWVPPYLALAEVHLLTGDLQSALRRVDEVAWLDLEADGGRDPLLQAPPAPLHTEALQAALRQRILEAVTADQAVVRAYGSLLAVECVIGDGGRCVEARQRLAGALEADPNDAIAQVMMARVHLAEGRDDAAIELLTGLVEGRAASPVAHVLLAEALDAVGRRDGADLQFKEAHNLAPEAAGIYRRHALALLAREDLEGARQQAQRARTLDPSDLVAAGILLR